MARFVMANRRAGKFTENEKLKSREALSETMNSDFMTGVQDVRTSEPKRETARQVVTFEADEKEIRRRKAEGLSEDVIVEPEIIHYYDSSRPMEFLERPRRSSGNIRFGGSVTLNLTVHGNGGPLRNAKVTLYLKMGNESASTTKTTKRNGRVRFTFSDKLSVLAVVVVPLADFWPRAIRGPRNHSVVECHPLPTARSHRGWWHDRLGIRQFSRGKGNGIKVGIADTGVGPHKGLQHVEDIGAFIAGLRNANAGKDIDSHGTHVCGIIGARPESSDHFGGIAPGVKVFSARVFQSSNGANQIDIANAIDSLSRDHEVDLINLSLGADTASEIERDAIIDAAERGTLCVCAAGNSNGAVEYPAAFSETLAISAVGLLGWGPGGESKKLPAQFERFGQENLYHANFSCFGPEISGAAPGVGIISTVPESTDSTLPYASMDGTSMASPAACAALAVVLSKDATYKSMPRDGMRTQHAKTLFSQSCRDLGLDAKYQGRGIPQT